MCTNNGSCLCQFWVWCYCSTWSKSKGHLHTWQDLFYDFQDTFLLSASYNRVETAKIWCSCHSEHRDYDILGCLSYPEDGGIGIHLLYCMASHPRGLTSEQIPIVCVCVCERDRERDTHTHTHHHPPVTKFGRKEWCVLLTLYDDKSSSSSRIIHHLH